MEWILFAIGVAVIGVIGIAIGVLVGRAVARRAARREGDEGAFMTPVGTGHDGPAAPTAGDGGDAPVDGDRG